MPPSSGSGGSGGQVTVNVNVNTRQAQQQITYLGAMMNEFGRQVTSRLTSMFSAVAVVTMAFQKVTQAMQQNIATAKQIGQLSAKFHIDPKEVHSLLLSANDAGVSVRALLMSMKQLGAAAGKASFSKDFRETFKMLGIDASKLSDMASKPAKHFAEVAKQLMQIGSETTRGAIGARLLGRQYQNMLPLIEKLGKSEEERQKFLNNENALGKREVDSAKANAKAQSEMNEAFNKLIATLMPLGTILTNLFQLIILGLKRIAIQFGDYDDNRKGSFDLARGGRQAQMSSLVEGHLKSKESPDRYTGLSYEQLVSTYGKDAIDREIKLQQNGGFRLRDKLLMAGLGPNEAGFARGMEQVHMGIYATPGASGREEYQSLFEKLGLENEGKTMQVGYYRQRYNGKNAFENEDFVNAYVKFSKTLDDVSEQKLASLTKEERTILNRLKQLKSASSKFSFSSNSSIQSPQEQIAGRQELINYNTQRQREASATVDAKEEAANKNAVEVQKVIAQFKTAASAMMGNNKSYRFNEKTGEVEEFEPSQSRQGGALQFYRDPVQEEKAKKKQEKLDKATRRAEAELEIAGLSKEDDLYQQKKIAIQMDLAKEEEADAQEEATKKRNELEGVATGESMAARVKRLYSQFEYAQTLHQQDLGSEEKANNAAQAYDSYLTAVQALEATTAEVSQHETNVTKAKAKQLELAEQLKQVEERRFWKNKKENEEIDKDDNDRKRKTHERRIKDMKLEGKSKQEIDKANFDFEVEELERIAAEHDKALLEANEDGVITDEERANVRAKEEAVDAQYDRVQDTIYAMANKGGGVVSDLRKVGGGGLAYAMADDVAKQELDEVRKHTTILGKIEANTAVGERGQRGLKGLIDKGHYGEDNSPD